MAARGTPAPTDELMRVVLRLYDQEAEAGRTPASIRASFLALKAVCLAIVLTALWLVLGSVQMVGTLQGRPLALHRATQPSERPDQPTMDAAPGEGAGVENTSPAGEPISGRRPPNDGTSEIRRDANDAIAALRLR